MNRWLFVIAATLVVTVTSCGGAVASSSSGVAQSSPGARVMALRTPDSGTVAHAYTTSDRCVVVHSGAAASLVFMTAGAETNPSGSYLSFSIGDYHGPGTYASHPLGKQGELLPQFTWSLSRWNAYTQQPNITVLTDDGRLVTGSVDGTLYAVVQRGTPVAAPVSGQWGCVLGDATPPMVTSTPQSFHTITNQGSSISIPDGWSSNRGSPIVFTAGTPIAYVSPQPLLDPCYQAAGLTVCEPPLPLLRPDSMVLGWFSGFLPGSPTRPSDARAFTTETGAGWIEVGDCTTALGDTLLTVTVPSEQLRITACLRGPDLPRMEAIAKAIMASTSRAQ